MCESCSSDAARVGEWTHLLEVATANRVGMRWSETWEKMVLKSGTAGSQRVYRRANINFAYGCPTQHLIEAEHLRSLNGKRNSLESWEVQ